MKKLNVLLLGLLVCAGARANSFSKVMIVIFENTNYEDAADLPFFKKLADEGALFENFYAETHPSQPNYIALVSGDTQGCKNDRNFNTTAPSVADLLEKKGLTWKVYAQAYPGNCFKGAKSKTYVRKHVPFMSFESISSDPKRCANIVNSDQLTTDIRNNTLPDYSLYIPDLNNDGHDTSPAYAEKWYANAFGPLIQNPQFMKGMLLVTTFDESSLFARKNHIYTSFYGAGVKVGQVSRATYNHYSLLKMVEDVFDLGDLSAKDATAASILHVWN